MLPHSCGWLATIAAYLYNIAMLVLNTQLENIPVMSLQSGTSLGTTTTPIIDPRKLQIVAYNVVGARIQVPSVLHTVDIREIGPLGYIVDSANSVMELDEDLVRLQEVVKLNFNLIGKQVIDDTKKKLGKVVDYTVESDSFLIQKLHLSQSVLKNIKNSSLIINRSQIVEITDREIIVRSATIQERVGLTQVLNPFRKNTQVMPESSTRLTSKLGLCMLPCTLSHCCTGYSENPSYFCMRWSPLNSIFNPRKSNFLCQLESLSSLHSKRS